LRFVFLIAAIATFLAGCEPGPELVVRQLSNAAQAGDWDAFADRLSPRSRALFSASRSTAAPEQVSLLAPPRLDELEVVGSRVLTKGSENEPATTAVFVRGSDGQQETVLVTRDEEGWRVDLFDNQRIWQRDRLMDLDKR